MFKKKKKDYIYLVAYMFRGGTGCITINLKRKVRCVDDIKIIQEYIADTNNIENVGVTHYQLVGRE